MKKYNIDSAGNQVLLNSLVKGWNISGIEFEKFNYETIITIKAGTKRLIFNVKDAQDISFQIKR